MKITLFLMLVFVTGLHANSMAQKISISLKNVKLDKAFAEIAAQTNHRFLYNDELIRSAAAVNIDVKDASLDQVMKQILKNQPLSYRMIAGTIIINEVAAPHSTSSAPLQQRTVSGMVTDASGSPLSGANISVRGVSGSSVTTADNGRYQINAAADATLVITYVGFLQREIPVDNRTTVNIILQPAMSTIEEVAIISTGYQTLDRKLFTGSAATLRASDVERSGVPDISRMLEGQVAGVSIQNVSGTFGAAPKIRIRGATSLSGDNKPLWVVDGIILEDVVNISNEALSTGDANTLIGSSVAGLNPNDIETFTILKDAAATAMYGARAMNGVIVVTTKKGRQTDGKPNINYTGNFTSYIKPNYNQFDIMNSAEQMSVLMELENKGYYSHASTRSAPTGGIFFKMYDEIYRFDPATETFGLRNDLQSRNDFLRRYAEANTDWFDLLFKNSLLQEHSVSVNFGTAKSQTYASTSYMHDNGQTIGDNVKRYTGNVRTNFEISERLKAELLFNGSIRDQQTPGTLTRTSDPVFGSYSRDFDINPYSYALNTSRLITPYDTNGDLEFFPRDYAPFNIYHELDNNYLKLNMVEFKVQGGATYKILPSLSYLVNGSYRYAKTQRQHYITDQSNMAQAYRAYHDPTIIENNRFLFDDPDRPNDLPFIVLPEGGFYNIRNDNLVNFYFRQDLDFDQTFRTDHRMNLFGSMEMRYTNRQNESFDGVGYQYANGGIVNTSPLYFDRAQRLLLPYFGMGFGYQRFVAFMFRGAYAYQDRYSVNFTTRYDGSNLMGRSTTARWLPTWNISGAWNIDQEAFFNSDNPILSSARLRGTYGLVASLGNATNSSAVFNNQVSRRPYPNEQETTISISHLENSELTWEKLYELNIGADLSFFNDRIDLTADVYQRNIFDLIGSIRTSGVGGQATKTANYGEMKAEGIEITLGGNPLNSIDFRWRTQFNMGYHVSKITHLEINPNIWTLVRAEGGAHLDHPQRGLFSITFDGLDPNYGYPTYIGTTGNKTVNVGFQNTDVDYLTYHGPVDPTLNGGFYNQFAYKGFSLSALFTFSTGNFIRLSPAYSPTYSDQFVMSRNMINRWMAPGDEQFTTVPVLLDQLTNNVRISGDPRYPYNAYNYSTERIAKGDFIRLKNISLGYSIPQRITSRLNLSSLQLVLVGNNIALLYSDKRLNGADPEFFGNGGVALPIPKQYTLSLKVGF